MTVTTASFRTNFPEFADVTRYPDAQLTFWLTTAGLLLNVDRWTTLLDVGTQLFMAHHVAVERRAQDEAANGETPGTTTGPISSKSVDKVSVGFDVGAATEERGGHWNLTIYGTRFRRLSKMMGAGPLQVGIDGPVPVLSTGTAWGYPWFINPNPSM